MDPGGFAEYEKTGKYRDGAVLSKNVSSRRLPRKRPAGMSISGRVQGPRGHDKDSKAFRTIPATGPNFRLRPQVSAQAEVPKNTAPRATQCPIRQRDELRLGLLASITLLCLSPSSLAYLLFTFSRLTTSNSSDEQRAADGGGSPCRPRPGLVLSAYPIRNPSRTASAHPQDGT